MNSYFDTSTLIKLVLEETGSDRVRTLWRRTDRALASAISYVEARAALASARRARRITEQQVPGVKVEFERFWRELTVIGVERPLLRFAGSLAELHGLRGYDAVQLASALVINEPVVFASADARLRDAAQTEGLALLATAE